VSCNNIVTQLILHFYHNGTVLILTNNIVSLAVIETYIIYDQFHDKRCVGYNMLMMLVICCSLQ